MRWVFISLTGFVAQWSQQALFDWQGLGYEPAPVFVIMAMIVAYHMTSPDR